MKTSLLLVVFCFGVSGCCTTATRELTFAPSLISEPTKADSGFRRVVADAPYLQRACLLFRVDGSLLDYLNFGLAASGCDERVSAVLDYGVRRRRLFLDVEFAGSDGKRASFSVPWRVQNGIEILYGTGLDRGEGAQFVGDRFSKHLFEGFETLREEMIVRLKTAQPGATDNPGDTQRLREDH